MFSKRMATVLSVSQDIVCIYPTHGLDVTQGRFLR